MEQSTTNDNLIVEEPKPIQWVIPDAIRTDHATHLIVQQQGTEFLLFFFEVETELLLGTVEEQIAAYKALPMQKAKCVAKLVISVENVGNVVNSLIESFNRMVQTMTKKGDKSAEDPRNTS